MSRYSNTFAQIDVEVQVIANTFKLIMQGKKEQYVNELSRYIKRLFASDQRKAVTVAQLSMVEAAEKVEREMDVQIGNPIKTLATYLD